MKNLKRVCDAICDGGTAVDAYNMAPGVSRPSETAAVLHAAEVYCGHGAEKLVRMVSEILKEESA